MLCIDKYLWLMFLLFLEIVSYLYFFSRSLYTGKQWFAYQLCTPTIVEEPCSNTSNTSLCKGKRLEHDDRSISEDTTFDKLLRQKYGLRYMHTLSKTYTT